MKQNFNTSEIPHIPSPSLPSVDSEHYCTNSEIMYNVTLRGGITSGTFRDRGKLPNMQECLRICCIAKSCDLAFMLSNHCFSVTCKNQTLCEVVTARTSGYKPQIAYIYARSNIVNQLNQIHTKGQSAVPLSEKHHYYSQKSNKTIHILKKDGSNRQREAKKKKLNQVNPSKSKKKPHKRKKLKRKRNHRRKYSKNNRVKLERMYAEERVLLRKLALLKLRMEILKKKNLGNDENIKDNVLLEAFEDKPKISKKSWQKITDSFTYSGNRTQKIGKSSAVKSTRLKMKPSSSSFRGAEDEYRKPSSRGNLFIRNRNTSRNTSVKTNSISSGIKRFLKGNSLLAERNYSPNYTTLYLPSFVINRTSNSSSNAAKMLVKETGKVNIVSEIQDHSKNDMQQQNFPQENRKQDKIGVVSLQESTKQLEEKEKNKNNVSRTVSLEEMISQTTEQKVSKSGKTVRNKGKYKKRTFEKEEKAAKSFRNLSLSKGAAKNFVNIVRNISSSISQSDEKPTESRTLTKNDLSSSSEIINKSQDILYPDKERKDLMLLNRHSLETGINDESQRSIKPTEKHYILQRNSSLRVSSRRKRR